ncbi:hypothetical protein LXL04_017589 [Taraxacum kok-saghyz]
MKQEACTKDVEHAFGVLQSRFAIVVGYAQLWRKEILHDIVTCCIIMHNMIIEYERDVNATTEDRSEELTIELEMVVDADVQFQ